MAETISSADLSDITLLHDLAPTATILYENHLANQRIWYPDELIPYDQARSFARNEQYTPAGEALSEGVQSALLVNLLTEDNLSYYYSSIREMLGKGGEVYEAWGHTWNFEEGRHSMVLRAILIAKRVLHHRQLEDARRQQVTTGVTPKPKNAKGTLVYTNMQEPATKISHRNTGKAIRAEDPHHADIQKAMGFVAGDEGMHEDFYGGLVDAGFVIDPSGFVIAADEEITEFAMPGTGITDFEAHAKKIAKAGILNIAILKEEIFDPALARWDIEHLEGLSPEAEKARDHLHDYMTRLTRTIEWGREKQARRDLRATGN
jgi:acyl-[acyl-carrier-protein] desaturase